MKNRDSWTATRFVNTANGYEASNDLNYVALGSRFIATIQAKTYQRLIKDYAQGLLLDLGCGYVPLYEIYREYTIDNVCIDWGNTFHKNPHLDLEVDLNSAEIPLKNETFDTILLTDVLEHISQPQILMSEVSRLLKQEGVLLLTVPFFYWLHEIPHDYFRFTEFALRMLCESNHLEVVELNAYGGAPEIIIDIIAKHISKYPILSALHLGLSQAFIRSNFGQALSKKTSKQFPLGYYLVARRK